MDAPELWMTLDAIEKHRWKIVLLHGRTKRPQGQTWVVVDNAAAVRYHFLQGGNIGLVCGPDSGVAALDFDVDGAMALMATSLGGLQSWVQTRKGTHCYVKWQDKLPARIMWNGQKMGEVQRGPSLQHVVIPPSINPDSQKPYLWLVDPSKTPLPDLPDGWVKHLVNQIPDYIKVGDTRGQPEAEKWDGPSPTELLFRASQQPGAKRRRNGVKFQCPGCRAEGHDNSKDNAIVYLDGRWGCAVDPEHKKSIGAELGMHEVTAALAASEVSDEIADDIMKKILG
jgi:hypothetical protein